MSESANRITEPKYSIGELAKALRVSTITVRRWISQGKIKHYRLGTKILIAESHIQEFLDSIETRGLTDEQNS